MPDALTLAVASIIFVAALVRSTFGFGDALVGMPLLALLVDIRVATPVMAFCALAVSLILIVPYWRSVRFEGLWPLAIAAIVGIPLGAIFLRQADDRIMKLLLAGVVLGFAAYRLARPDRWTLASDRYAWLFGFVAGVLGGAYNTGGPPVVIYGSLRRWSPQGFRSTMQGFALLIGGFVLAGHALAGLWTKPVYVLFGWSAPGLVLAVFLGDLLHRRIPQGRFDRLILVFLLAIGGLLLVRIGWDALGAAS